MKKIYGLLAVIFTALAGGTFLSCSDDDDKGGNSNLPKVIIPDSVGGVVNINTSDFPGTFEFNFAIDKPSTKSLTFDIAVDESLVSSYGNDYELAPKATFYLDKSAAISVGKQSSNEFRLTFSSLWGYEEGGKYVIPIRITPDEVWNNAVTVDNSSNIIYVVINPDKVITYKTGIDMSNHHEGLLFRFENNAVYDMGDYAHTLEMLIYPYSWLASGSTTFIGAMQLRNLSTNATFDDHILRVDRNTGRTNHAFNRTSSTISSPSLGRDQWILLTVAVDGANSTNPSYRYYVNGVLRQTLRQSRNMSVQAGLLGMDFSTWQDGGAYWFDGLIGEFRLWSKALTDDEVAANVNGVENPSASDFIGLWNMEEGEGNILYDSSGNGRNLVVPGENPVWGAEIFD